MNSPPAPTASRISVARGREGHGAVFAHDPDGGDAHEFVLLDPPQTGEVEVLGSGLLAYRASANYAGPESFSVLVTDDGDPPLSGVVTVEVDVLEVIESHAPGGCNSAPAHAPWWPAWLALAGRRR
jgi:hypothetical protein